ncbi:ABC transporter substrate-binding protein [Burkholderia pyrrocinia]|uniref:ABC transporter substrate-binding protein n=1 Tax=Burkholderia pyrrocinia TaxID=60550 RepID=UPI002AB2827E|nr:extracellular solute-binding protein [Burkholderia pyrrocinia]
MNKRTYYHRILRFGVAATVAIAAHAASATTILKVWALPWSDSAHKAFEGMIADFERVHPDVDVRLETRGIDEHKTAVRVALSSGEGPDIYYMWGGPGLGGEFVNERASAPLDQAYDRFKWDDRFEPTALADSRRYAGGRHGVPFMMRGEGVYYNKTLFKQAGISDPPRTYDELLAAAQELKTKHIPSFVFGGNVNWHLMRLMDVLMEVKCGADKHDALMGMRLNWRTEPCAKASFDELKYWSDNFLLKPFMGIADDQAQGLFYAGRVAMALEGDWFVQNIKSHADMSNFGLFAFPTGTGRLYFFSEYLYVSSRSRHKEIAAEFLNFVTSQQEQQKYLGQFSSMSVVKGLDYRADPLQLNSAWRDVFRQATGIFTNGDQAFPLDVTTEYWRIMNLVASDDMQPDQAAVAMQRFIDNRRR